MKQRRRALLKRKNSLADHIASAFPTQPWGLPHKSDALLIEDYIFLFLSSGVISNVLPYTQNVFHIISSLPPSSLSGTDER